MPGVPVDILASVAMRAARATPGESMTTELGGDHLACGEPVVSGSEGSATFRLRLVTS